MMARALLKQSYYGPEVMRVNLLGKGVVDCDRKVAALASELKADYWEIQYHKSWGDLPAFRLKVGKNGVTWAHD